MEKIYIPLHLGRQRPSPRRPGSAQGPQGAREGVDRQGRARGHGGQADQQQSSSTRTGMKTSGFFFFLQIISPLFLLFSF